MIKHDFETGGFPINKRAPILCLSADGKIYPVYNRFHLHAVLNNAEVKITKALGVWPGKVNTDCFVLNPELYKLAPAPPRVEFADIDSAEEVTIFYDQKDNFRRLTYKEDISEISVITSEDRDLLRYIEQAGIKHKVIHEA